MELFFGRDLPFRRHEDFGGDWIKQRQALVELVQQVAETILAATTAVHAFLPPSRAVTDDGERQFVQEVEVPYHGSHRTPPGPNFRAGLRNDEADDTFSGQLYLYGREIFPTPPFSTLTLSLLWGNRALKVSPRGVR